MQRDRQVLLRPLDGHQFAFGMAGAQEPGRVRGPQGAGCVADEKFVLFVGHDPQDAQADRRHVRLDPDIGPARDRAEGEERVQRQKLLGFRIPDRQQPDRHLFRQRRNRGDGRPADHEECVDLALVQGVGGRSGIEERGVDLRRRQAMRPQHVKGVAGGARGFRA